MAVVVGVLWGADAPDYRYPQERYLGRVYRLTSGGTSAEAYTSFSGRWVVFQHSDSSKGIFCDQIFLMEFRPGVPTEARMVSTGRGRTTCAYFLPGDSLILYSSTHHRRPDCGVIIRRFRGRYVWQLDTAYDIFVARLDGTIVAQLTDNNVYDAEATVSPQGNRIVFTSLRGGDPELYLMNLDGSGVKQLTDSPGYEGGAFFSPSGRWIVFRAYYPASDSELAEYRYLLSMNLISPVRTEIYIMDTAGRHLRQVTALGGASWAPVFTSDEKYIVFSSNFHALREGRPFPFNLFAVDTGGRQVIQLTYDGLFDAFPFFTPDGRYLLWSSARASGSLRHIDVFAAEWLFDGN